MEIRLPLYLQRSPPPPLEFHPCRGREYKSPCSYLRRFPVPFPSAPDLGVNPAVILRALGLLLGNRGFSRRARASHGDLAIAGRKGAKNLKAPSTRTLPHSDSNSYLKLKNVFDFHYIDKSGP